MSLENVRLATNEENKGLELVEQMIPSLKEEIRQPDPYRALIPRMAWESLYDAQAPGPALPNLE